MTVENPAYILLDILRRSGWDDSEIDLASFDAMARYCENPVPYPETKESA
jgi:hypothetical protein